MDPSKKAPKGFDWFYEQRPIIYVIIGVVAVLGGIKVHDPIWSKILYGASFILFIVAWIVADWRKKNRK